MTTFLGASSKFMPKIYSQEQLVFHGAEYPMRELGDTDRNDSIIRKARRKRIQRRLESGKPTFKGTLRNPMTLEQRLFRDLSVSEKESEIRLKGTRHTLTIRILKAEGVEIDETFEDSFEIYRKYEAKVHKRIVDREEEIDIWNMRFVQSPLLTNSKNGTFHCHYLLDGWIYSPLSL